MFWRAIGAATGAAILGPLLCGSAAGEGFLREVFFRVFVSPGEFKATIASYVAATHGRCSMYFPFPERKLDLAAVSSPKVSFLIIAGEPAALERFRQTPVTFHVYILDEALNAARSAGATIIQDRTDVPTGVQARVRLPDGLVVEYVEHNEAARRFYNCAPLGIE